MSLSELLDPKILVDYLNFVILFALEPRTALASFQSLGEISVQLGAYVAIGTALSVAARRDRMVRVTIHPDTGAIWASVDLTGCPATVRDALLNRAVAHLRSVVERLLPVVRVLNNPSVASRALCSDALSPTAMEKDE